MGECRAGFVSLCGIPLPLATRESPENLAEYRGGGDGESQLLICGGHAAPTRLAKQV